MVAHWGSILTEGTEYEGSPCDIYLRTGQLSTTIYNNTELELITNNDEYYKYTSMIASSIEFIRKGYTEENMTEVMPLYKTYKEVHRLYTRSITVDFISVSTDDNSHQRFVVMSRDEMMRLYNVDFIKFNTSVDFVEDYFDYKLVVIRDRKLTELGL
jgi:hypothetical protein